MVINRIREKKNKYEFAMNELESRRKINIMENYRYGICLFALAKEEIVMYSVET